ncbi:MAG: radical SAM/SPASM domain-containing protein [Candidatus Woesearchaeota archaeon]
MIKENAYVYLLEKIIYSKKIRPLLLKQFYNMAHKALVENNKTHNKAVMEKKYQYFRAMLECALRNIDKGYISKDVAKKIIRTLVKNALLKDEKTIARIKKKYGEVPAFIVLSPTSKCNLKCTGCYAAAGGVKFNTLPFDVVNKIVKESHDWGNRFMTISGGEPFLYNYKGKTLFDIWKKYNDMFFLVYTNSTFITPEIAKKLAKLGNVTPAISVEGFEKETDERRGKGVFKRILQSFKNLREAGVPFGISVTATRKNVKLLLSDKFYDYYFINQGASYMWQFQLMPIGRGKDCMELMITPKDRVKLYSKWKHLLEDKKYCVADFWNSGVLSDGCIAYGREAGYLYINWDGNIMPCVFVPYYVDNIIDLYKKGKTLHDALNSEFFRRGREWQKEYGLKNIKKPKNWLMPCSIRDHYRNWKDNIATRDIKPENKDAEEALKSEEYRKKLEEFDNELTRLTEKIWKKEYLEAD